MNAKTLLAIVKLALSFYVLYQFVWVIPGSKVLLLIACAIFMDAFMNVIKEGEK